MSVGIGVVILVLVVASVALLRAGAGMAGVVFLLIATGLFVMTPLGAPLPGHLWDAVQWGSEHTGGDAR